MILNIRKKEIQRVFFLPLFSYNRGEVEMSELQSTLIPIRKSIMTISVLDGSNYFKGLLLLVRKDLKVSESELHLMKRIGKTLGFEPEFCENAIRDVLENEYLVDEPLVFSSQELAMKFIRDGLALAFSDKELHPSEEEWLLATAEQHGLDQDWFREEYGKISGEKDRPLRLEVDEMTVEHSLIRKRP